MAKILLVEDNTSDLKLWFKALKKDGIPLEDDEPFSGSIKSVWNGLLVLNFGDHEIHITGNKPALDQAVDNNDYDLCVMDWTLKGLETSDDATLFLLTQKPKTKVLFTSGCRANQEKILGSLDESHFEELMRKKIIARGEKDYSSFRPHLLELLGLEPSQRGKNVHTSHLRCDGPNT